MTEQVNCETARHKVEWDYSDVYPDEEGLSITGSCKKCEAEFMATFTNPLYSILDDKNELQNFDDEVTWLN